MFFLQSIPYPTKNAALWACAVYETGKSKRGSVSTCNARTRKLVIFNKFSIITKAGSFWRMQPSFQRVLESSGSCQTNSVPRRKNPFICSILLRKMAGQSTAFFSWTCSYLDRFGKLLTWMQVAVPLNSRLLILTVFSNRSTCQKTFLERAFIHVVLSNSPTS